MKINDKILSWLLEGDVSIQYQVNRDLLESDSQTIEKLQNRIATEGWGKEFLSKQNPDGHWGLTFYQPKWISTHYTLLDLTNLGISRDNKTCRAMIDRIFAEALDAEGIVNFSRSKPQVPNDVCLAGTILYMAVYFKKEEEHLTRSIDYLINRQMSDGGWNCEDFHGAHHSSLHTTLSVLEGLYEFTASGYTYRTAEIEEARKRGLEFIYIHHLYKSDKTGKIIDKRFTMLSYPSRWRYDILRALDLFQKHKVPYDPRMTDAFEVILKKQKKDGTWPLQTKHPGQVHFDMEKAGKSSRWNTLRVLRVLKWFEKDLPGQQE